MGSRRKTGRDAVRLPDITRRSVIGAASAAPVMANAAGTATPDSLTDRCGTFVATDIRIRRLLMRWGDLESDAAKNYSWFKLTRREQLESAQGQEMARIDRELSRLFREREKLLKSLPQSVATDPTAIAAKIAAAAKAIDPEDHEEVHHLLSGATRDMAAMRCPGCKHAVSTAV